MNSSTNPFQTCWPFPEAGVSGVGKQREMAGRDVGGQHPHQGRRREKVRFSRQDECWDAHGLKPGISYGVAHRLGRDYATGSAGKVDFQPAPCALRVCAPVGRPKLAQFYGKLLYLRRPQPGLDLRGIHGPVHRQWYWQPPGCGRGPGGPARSPRRQCPPAPWLPSGNAPAAGVQPAH